MDSKRKSPVVLIAAIVLSGLLLGCGKSSTKLSQVTTVIPIPLPQGKPGIGFDDLRFSANLNKVLVPAGRSGNIDLIDPSTLSIIPLPGFSTQSEFSGGHDFGVTSVDEGSGWLFATDRTTLRLYVIDPNTKNIKASASLSASPDYIRYVAATHELWISEPDKDQLEIFSLSDELVPSHSGTISTPGGPESLVIDNTRSRAFAHLWAGATIAVDLKTRKIADTWANGCRDSRGIALNEARGFLFAACKEGKVTVLNAETGEQISSASHGSGVDIIDYNPALGHLYLPGGTSATLGIIAVSKQGHLTLLGSADTAAGAHCVVADNIGNAYVCDVNQGRLLKVPDPFPPTVTSGP